MTAVVIVLAFAAGAVACELWRTLFSYRRKSYTELVQTLLTQGEQQGYGDLTVSEVLRRLELGLIDARLDRIRRDWLLWADRKKRTP